MVDLLGINMLNSVKTGIVRSLFRYSSDITMFLGIEASVFAGGLLLTDDSSLSNASHLSGLVWAAIFSVYGLLKLVESYRCLPNYLSIGASILGIWAWSYMLVLFTVLGYAPLNTVLFVPLVCEIWALTSRLFNNGCKV